MDPPPLPPPVLSTPPPVSAAAERAAALIDSLDEAALAGDADGAIDVVTVGVGVGGDGDGGGGGGVGGGGNGAPATPAAVRGTLTRAHSLTVTAAAGGCARGRTLLAALLRRGVGLPAHGGIPSAEVTRAVWALLHAAAVAGDAAAAVEVGDLLLDGAGAGAGGRGFVPPEVGAVAGLGAADTPDGSRVVMDVDADGSRMRLAFAGPDGSDVSDTTPPAELVAASRAVRRQARAAAAAETVRPPPPGADGSSDGGGDTLNGSAASVTDPATAARRTAALGWYTAAAAAGMPAAHVAAASVHMAAGNEERAEAALTAAADGGAAAGHAGLGVLYAARAADISRSGGGDGNAADARRAVKHLVTAAEAGDGDGMLALAHAYRSGSLGLTASPTRAAALVQAAAEGGHPEATWELAYLHRDVNDSGVPRSRARFLALTRRAAALGVADAAACLGGLAYAGEEGVAVDYVAARRWYNRAAAGGSADGAAAGAAMAAAGLGGPRSAVEAFHRYTHAASLGSVTAARVLGGLYWRGEGTDVDRAAARRVWAAVDAAEEAERAAGRAAEAVVMPNVPLPAGSRAPSSDPGCGGGRV
ncbi:hypothetical protein MMPV_005187 [Pyropia vietnamensis]